MAEFSGFYTEWGVWFFLVQALVVALTALVPPLPAELMVIASGAMSADGVLPMSWAFTATFAGCLAGDIGLYALFRYKFIRALHRWRWGRLLHRRIIRISLRAGTSHTWVGLLLLIAMPFGRSAAMATAGMIRIPWVPLLALAIAGGFLWSWWLLGLGYVPTIATNLPLWGSTFAGIAVGTLAGAAIAFIGTRGRRIKP